jgi:hypothetical protein
MQRKTIYPYLFLIAIVRLFFPVHICMALQKPCADKSRVVFIENIRAEIKPGDFLTITVLTDKKYDIKPRSFSLFQPNRLVFDLPGTFPAEAVPRELKLDAAKGTKVRMGIHRQFTRIVLDLGNRAFPEYQVATGDRHLIFTFHFQTPESKGPGNTAEFQPIEFMESAEIDSELPAAGEEKHEGGDKKKALEDGTSQKELGEKSWEEEDTEGVWDDNLIEEAEGDPAGVSWGEEETEATLKGPKSASRFEGSGRLWNKFAYDTKDDNEFESDLYNHAEARIEAKYVSGERFHAVVSVDADYFAYHGEDDWDDDSDVRLYLAYINLAGNDYNLKLGNQIVRWGKSDGYSPLDNINPEDFRDGIGGRREDRKLPIPMVNLELYRGSNTLQGIFIPLFEEPEIDYIGTDWSLFGHVDQEFGPVAIKEKERPNTLRNSEAGVRLSGIVRNFDYAFSYLYSREKIPSFRSLIVPPGFSPLPGSISIKDLAVFACETNQEITLEYGRRNIYGFEFETTLGDFGFRGDATYIDDNNFFTNQLQRIRKPAFQYMVGADYNAPLAFYINVQFAQTFIQDYDDRIVFADEVANAVNGSLWKEFYNGDVKLEFRYYYDFSGSFGYYNPKIILNHWQNLLIELGTEFFDASEDSIFGLFKENDQVYGIVELKF